MVNHKCKRAVFGITTALVFSACTLPVMAAPTYANTDVSMSVVSSDETYAGGLDLEARIITTVEQDQRSPYAKKGIAVTDDYLSIRTEPKDDAEVVGKLYTGSGCDIQEVSDGWAHIVSGECEGYVKAKYLLSGTDAEAYAAANNVSELVAKSQNEEMFLYEEPSADSKIVATVLWDQELSVLGASEDDLWAKVSIGDKTGYIPADSIILDVKYEEAVSIEAEKAAKAEETEAPETEAPETESKETEASETEAPETEAPETEASVSIEDVNETVWATYSVSIRAKASTDGEKLGVLIGSDSITRTGICDNGWSRVDYHGTEAYIKSEYLTKDEPAVPEEPEQTEEPEATPETKETVYATAGVNIRAKASADSDVIGTLIAGYSITRTSNEDGWSKVDYNGKTGYIKSDYLTTTKPQTSAGNDNNSQPAEEVKETVYATAGVNIRAKASADSDVIGTLIAGYSITRTSNENGWSKVDYNGKTGYIKSDYLTTTKPQAAETTNTNNTTNTSSSENAIEEVNETVYATAGVNIRAKASADSDRIGSLAAGNGITRTGKVSNGWSRVEFSGKTGYIKSDYLTTEKPAVTTSSSTTATSSSSSSSLGQEIADFAVQYVGYPYVYGGNSLTNGVDCSGFTQQVYLHFGYSIPRRASIQGTVGTSVAISDLQPGDLVFYGDSTGIGHVTIYIGDGQVVHASTPSKGIIISDLYYRTPMCAKRII